MTRNPDPETTDGGPTMQRPIRLSVFDFDGTLCSFDTADAFVFFATKGIRSAGIRFKKTVGKLWRRLSPALFPGTTCNAIHKRLVLWQLRGLSRSFLEERARQFWLEKIHPALRPETMALLERRRKEGCRLWLVSASYDLYLEHFANDCPFEKLVSTRIRFENGVCTGRFDGRDVCGVEKVRRIGTCLGPETHPVEVVSDSASDLPLFSLADSAVVVFKGSKPPKFSSTFPCKLLPCKQ